MIVEYWIVEHFGPPFSNEPIVAINVSAFPWPQIRILSMRLHAVAGLKVGEVIASIVGDDRLISKSVPRSIVHSKAGSYGYRTAHSYVSPRSRRYSRTVSLSPYFTDALLCLSEIAVRSFTISSSRLRALGEIVIRILTTKPPEAHPSV